MSDSTASPTTGGHFVNRAIVVLSIACSVAALSLTLSERNRNAEKSAQAPITSQSSQLAESLKLTDSKLAIMDGQITQIEKRLTDIEGRVWARDGEATASIPLSSTNFSTAIAGGLMFPISIKNLEKYANGYRFVLVIGNPHQVTLSNVSTKIEFGLFDLKKSDQNFGRKTINHKILEPLLPGTWNESVVVLAPLTESELTPNVFITIETQTMQLRNDPRRKH